MAISLGHVVLLLGGVLVSSLLLRYLKLFIHLILSGKLAVLTLVAFVTAYATRIWRPDLSPLLRPISKLRDILG